MRITQFPFRYVAITALSLLACASQTVIAQEIASKISTPNLSQSLLQVFGALVFIVGLILVAAWLAKRLKIVGGGSGQQIKALSVLPLGRKEKVVLIESCGKRMLVGVSSNAVNTLHVFESDHIATGKHFSDIHAPLQANADCSSDALSDVSGDNSVPTSEEKSIPSREFSSFLKAVMSGRKNEN